MELQCLSMYRQYNGTVSGSIEFRDETIVPVHAPESAADAEARIQAEATEEEKTPTADVAADAAAK